MRHEWVGYIAVDGQRICTAYGCTAGEVVKKLAEEHGNYKLAGCEISIGRIKR